MIIIILLLFTAIKCPALSAFANGDITYAPDTTAPFEFLSIATHSCNIGFFLTGDETRSCGGDGSSAVGVWNGTASTCSGRQLDCYFIPEKRVACTEGNAYVMVIP